MRRLISLGLSCQSRFAINLVGADHRRLPFDFNITTKPALLDALHTGGEAFRFERPDALEIYRTPSDGVEGPVLGGVHFWHDFPRIAHRGVDPDWRTQIAKVRRKYSHNWGVFEDLAKGPGGKTMFLVSNAQVDLTEFAAASDWNLKFRLTAGFYTKLKAALTAFGAEDFDVVFFNRSLTDSIEANHALQGERFLSVFAGVQALPVNAAFATATLLSAGQGGPSVAALAGRYDGGREVIPLADDRAAVRADGAPVAEIRSALGGYMAVFADGPDRVLTAVTEGRDIYWSDKTRWLRAAS